ncbi:MAG: CmpA/NrtA family ABC transporter substrate-binding protein [Acidimicrobiales bacterium]
MTLSRRRFLQQAMAFGLGGGGLAASLGACGGAGSGSASSSTGSGGATSLLTPVTASAAATTVADKPVRKVNLGFIALTDAAPIIMAKELGLFDQYKLDVTVAKQASWPALRDALQNGQIDGAHCLFGMPFSVATGVGGNGARDLKIAMMLNQNGQAITLSKDFEGIGYGDLAAAREILASKDAPDLGMTFPGGTHDLWLRYWLMAAKADVSKLKISPIPPPQMVQNMEVGNVKGYCVGEPWNARAVAKGIGFTYLATQDLWDNHPEKALVVNKAFAETQEDTLKDVMAAVLDASKWLDDTANRQSTAQTIGVEAYVSATPEEIGSRLVGKYDLGGGLGSKDFAGRQMQFFQDGKVSFPRRGHGVWFLSQYVRMGLLKEAPPYQELADELILTDLYGEVATNAGIAVPADDMSPFTIALDKVTFDPRKPAQEGARP